MHAPESDIEQMELHVTVDKSQVEAFCRRNHIRRLSLFGSVLRSDFPVDSDIDVLVEFDPEHVPGLLRLARMERELGSLFGRPVDIRTPEDLSHYFRQEVVDSAMEQFVAT